MSRRFEGGINLPAGLSGAPKENDIGRDSEGVLRTYSAGRWDNVITSAKGLLLTPAEMMPDNGDINCYGSTEFCLRGAGWDRANSRLAENQARTGLPNLNSGFTAYDSAGPVPGEIGASILVQGSAAYLANTTPTVCNAGSNYCLEILIRLPNRLNSLNTSPQFFYVRNGAGTGVRFAIGLSALPNQFFNGRFVGSDDVTIVDTESSVSIRDYLGQTVLLTSVRDQTNSSTYLYLNGVEIASLTGQTLNTVTATNPDHLSLLSGNTGATSLSVLGFSDAFVHLYGAGCYRSAPTAEQVATRWAAIADRVNLANKGIAINVGKVSRVSESVIVPLSSELNGFGTADLFNYRPSGYDSTVPSLVEASGVVGAQDLITGFTNNNVTRSGRDSLSVDGDLRIKTGYFDNVTDNSSFKNLTQYSVTLVIKMSKYLNYAANTRNLMGISVGTSGNSRLALKVTTTGILGVSTRGGDADSEVSFNTTTHFDDLAGRWCVFVFTYDSVANERKVYLNGILANGGLSTTAINAVANTNPQEFRILYDTLTNPFISATDGSEEIILAGYSGVVGVATPAGVWNHWLGLRDIMEVANSVASKTTQINSPAPTGPGLELLDIEAAIAWGAL